MVAPSLTWAPSRDTSLTLLRPCHEDDGGSTSQFLPHVGTLPSNTVAGKLPNDLFGGKPRRNRYDGRLLEGVALFNQGLGDRAKISLKARYIDTDLSYFTHYPNSYSNPSSPYVLLDAAGAPVRDPVTGVALPDPEQRHVGPHADNASTWESQGFALPNDIRLRLRLGGGARYSGENQSGSIVMPDYISVDGFAEPGWRQWSLSVGATNPLDAKFYAAYLERGDYLIGAECNALGTLCFRF